MKKNLISTLNNYCSLPWSRHTLLGYFAEIFYNFWYCVCYLSTHGAHLMLFISVCSHHMAFHAIFKRSIDNLNNIEGMRCDKKFLIGLIRFHMSVKE